MVCVNILLWADEHLDYLTIEICWEQEQDPSTFRAVQHSAGFCKYAGTERLCV